MKYYFEKNNSVNSAVNSAGKIGLHLVIFCIIIVGSLGLYLYKQNYQKNSAQTDTVQTIKETEWGTPEVAKQEAEKLASELPIASESYTNHELGISFKYPKDLVVSSFTESTGENVGDRTILVQNPEKNIGLQIVAMPFIDPINTLTEERVEKDLDINISKYSIINIGKNNNIQAVTFLSGDSVLYREVWFVKNSLLFEVKAYQSSEPLIVAILQTLEI